MATNYAGKQCPKCGRSEKHTAPRKPLTDECGDIYKMLVGETKNLQDYYSIADGNYLFRRLLRVARAIERAHGIGEE